MHAAMLAAAKALLHARRVDERARRSERGDVRGRDREGGYSRPEEDEVLYIAQ